MATAGIKVKLEDLSGALGFGSSIFTRRRRDQAVDDSFTYNRGVSRYNQYIAKERGRETLQAGAVDFADTHRKVRYDADQVRADAAARGVAANEGSAAELYQGALNVGAISEQRTMENAYSAARAEYDRVQELRMQQQLASIQRKNQKEESRMEMFGSMFSNTVGFTNTLKGWFGS